MDNWLKFQYRYADVITRGWTEVDELRHGVEDAVCKQLDSDDRKIRRHV